MADRPISEHGATLIAAAKLDDEGLARLAAEKLAAGRYTLEEATQFLRQGARVRAEPMQQKLIDAAVSGALPVYAPGELQRYRYGNKAACGSEPRWYYEEAYWDDLNQWLETHEQRIACRFPSPSAAPTKGTTLPPLSATDPSSTVHRLSKRTDALTAVIEQARSAAVNAQDYHSVWAALVRLAQPNDRPAPLLGYVEGEGVKYSVEQSETPRFLTKSALGKRFTRAAARSNPPGPA